MDAKALLDLIKGGLASLPGESAHQEAMPVNRPFSSNALKDAINYRESAVSIVLYSENDKLKSILIQRPEYDGVHSKQIAFPGGKKDPTDSDLIHTAIRECSEEINVHLNRNQLLGELTPVFIPVSQFLVQPYIFYIDDKPRTFPEVREVDEIIHFNISDLLNSQVLKYQDMQFKDGIIRKGIPYYSVEKKIVWGATAMMLAELRQMVLF